MSAVPRHIFVEEVLATRAYDDVALPINFGQTISSPYIVARMSELLRAGSQLGKVLEIGSGCGYQTAILAQFAARFTRLNGSDRCSPAPEPGYANCGSAMSA